MREDAHTSASKTKQVSCRWREKAKEPRIGQAGEAEGGCSQEDVSGRQRQRLCHLLSLGSSARGVEAGAGETAQQRDPRPAAPQHPLLRPRVGLGGPLQAAFQLLPGPTVIPWKHCSGLGEKPKASPSPRTARGFLAEGHPPCLLGLESRKWPTESERQLLFVYYVTGLTWLQGRLQVSILWKKKLQQISSSFSSPERSRWILRSPARVGRRSGPGPVLWVPGQVAASL